MSYRDTLMPHYARAALIFLSPLLFSLSLASAEQPDSELLLRELLESPNILVNDRMQEGYEFSGLASYYNNVSAYIVEESEITKIERDQQILLETGQWFAAVGRFRVLLVRAPGLSITHKESSVAIKETALLDTDDTYVNVHEKSELSAVAQELDQIRYVYLWKPLASLSKVMESQLVWIQGHLINSWGLAVILFAALLRLLLTPIDLAMNRVQNRVREIESKLAPRLEEIKENYDGEQAHRLLMLVHEEAGVSPFYKLKPLLGSLVQIPILIAVFNALGEMPQMNGQSFLWIENLAYPDAIVRFRFSIPMLGDTLNLLPFLLAAVTVLSVSVLKMSNMTETQQKCHNRNIVLMAIAFFILFYPFPAVMVLYWAFANIFQTIQQRVIRKYS